MSGDWRAEFERKLVSPAEAARLVQPRDTVYTGIGGDARSLMPALFARIVELEMRVRVHACSPTPHQDWWADEFAEMGFDLALEIYNGPTARPALARHDADFYPLLFSNQFNVWDHRPEDREPIDVFATSVSAPDADGYVHFGGTPWQKADFCRRARTTILEVCPWFPDIPTTERLHVSEVTAFIPTELEPPPPRVPNPSAEAETIAGYVNEIVQDGDTVQIGAGRSANVLAAAGAFEGKRDLGWHSEITPFGVVRLMMDGVFNGSRKNIDRGLHVTTTVIPRDDEERDWLTHDPPLITRAVREVNAIPTIARIERMVSINNAFTVDLTGQICSESLGTQVYNGTGGQPEFHIGAALAPGGKAITVLPSSAREGAITRIVPSITDGSYVTVPRTFADFVVTEHGIARLAGKSQRQRADALIAVAHPDHRAELRKATQTMFYPGGVRRSVLGEAAST